VGLKVAAGFLVEGVAVGTCDDDGDVYLIKLQHGTIKSISILIQTSQNGMSTK
jgi:hypothetical protein